MHLYKSSGFTLIELMIVVVIIAVIAAIAIHAYSDYVSRSRRADAKSGLLLFQIEQEKYRANNVTYGNSASLGLPSASPDGYYTVSVSGAVSSTAYELIAQPAGDQTGDDCGTFAINQDGKVTSGSYANSDCWSR